VREWKGNCRRNRTNSAVEVEFKWIAMASMEVSSQQTSAVRTNFWKTAAIEHRVSHSIGLHQTRDGQQSGRISWIILSSIRVSPFFYWRIPSVVNGTRKISFFLPSVIFSLSPGTKTNTVPF
jgi:hypothetical protein